MKQTLTYSERAEIYETAYRVYCSTQSSDYAFRRAATVGDRLKIAPLRVDEIARDAIEKVRELQRAYAESLLEETEKRVREYANMFPSTSNPYLEPRTRLCADD